MSRTTTTKTRVQKTTVAGTSKSLRTAKDSDARSVLPCVWSATEPGPRKRWWWYVGFTIVAVWLTALLALLREWSALAATVIATVAVFVTYGRRPRQMSYRLDAKKLIANGQTLRLDDYRAFTTEVPQPKPGSDRPVTALLLPKRRLGFPLQIALPEDVDEADAALSTLEQVLTFDDAEGYLAGLRFFDRLARWLRLI